MYWGLSGGAHSPGDERPQRGGRSAWWGDANVYLIEAKWDLSVGGGLGMEIFGIAAVEVLV